MLFVGEGGGVGLLLRRFVLIEVFETLGNESCHSVGVEVGEIVGMGAANLGERGAVGAEDGFAPLHGFDNRESESFGDGRKEKGCAVGVKPAPLGVGHETNDMHIGMGGKLGANRFGVVCFVVAGNDKMIIGETVHQWKEGVHLLLLSHFSNKKEERCSGNRQRLLGPSGEVFNTVIDDMDRFVVEVDEALGILAGKVGDEGEFGGTVTFTLQLATIFALFFGCLLVKEVDVVDGEDKACTATFGMTGTFLVDGMPDIEVGHEPRTYLAEKITANVVNVAAKSTDIVFGYEKCDVETVGKFTCMLLVPPAVIEGYLSQSAHGMAENAEVNEYAFLFHLGVNWK